MADELNDLFQKATQDIKTLSKAPDNEVMLRLYALYKQATQGDCTGDRPGMMDFVGRAKYDAWKGLEGTSQEGAMRQYIAVVEEQMAADK